MKFTVLEFTRGRPNLGFNNAKLQVMNLHEKPLRSLVAFLDYMFLSR